MATTARRPGVGTFESEYHDLGLYTLVRVIAEFVSPDDPTSVSQAAWDGGRAPSGHPDAPSARAICARLADREGKPFPWRELLELVFDPSRDIEQTHALRRGESNGAHFTEEHVFYALQRVAHELGVSTLAPDAYAQQRATLVANARRRSIDLTELLPTVGQIERVAGGWDQALELAELEPRPELSGSRPAAGTPIVEALELYAEATGGWFCNRTVLQQFARDRDVALAAQASGTPWNEYVAEATARRETQGKPIKGMAPPGARPSYAGMGEGGTKRREREIRPPGFWTLELCLEAIRRFLADLTPSVNPTQKRYLAWSRDHDDAPAPATFAQYGGWKVLLGIARGAAPASTAAVPKRRAAERRHAIVLAHLDATGKITTRDVQALLGVNPVWASTILRELRERGEIVLGSEKARGRGVFYVGAKGDSADPGRSSGSAA
jgi:hypothetical protein